MYTTVCLLSWLNMICNIALVKGAFDFTGPSDCSNTDNGSTMKGYSDLLILNQDMYSEAYSVIVENSTQAEKYTYTICPGTTFDYNILTNETGSDPYIVPYLSNVTVVCGDGDGDDDCTFFGGDGYHIYFVPQFISMNVKFVGFTFTNNLYTSVAAFGHPLSYAIFHNCTWVDNNFDMFAIDMYFDPSNSWGRRHRHHRELESGKEDEFLSMLEDSTTSSPNYEDLLPYVDDYNNAHYKHHNNKKERRTLGYPSMLVWFNQSYFVDNYATSIINNEGGILDLQDTTFADNRVFLAVVDVLFGGHLVMRNSTSFTSNTITFVPVFLDSTSMLQLNTADVYGGNQMSIGSNDDGQDCLNGIFIEDENSYCLHGGKCLGSCCDFGDDSCDMYVPKDTSFQLEDAPSPFGDNSIPITTSQSSTSTSTSTTKGNHNVKFQAPASVTITNKNEKTMNKAAYAGIISGVVILSVIVIAMFAVFFKRHRRKRDVELGNAPEHQIA